MTTDTPTVPPGTDAGSTALALDQICITGNTQPRARIDEDVVKEYAQLTAGGTKFPPVTVYFDGATYWLADGFHRYWANKQIEAVAIFADVHEGTQRDAILHSLGANAAHGLRRAPGDKRKAIVTMLEDEEWSGWSNCAIARHCGVDEKYVRKMKEIHTSDSPKYESSHRTFTHPKTGKPTRMQTGNIGRGSRKAKPAFAPSEMNPQRKPRPALAQTNVNLPHDPVYGARAIVSAMGPDYARNLIDSITTCLKGS